MAAEDWAPRDAALVPWFAAWRRGAYDAAEQGFTAAIAAAHGTDPDAWRGLGSVHWSRGRHVAAFDAFLAALRLEPDRPMAWSNIGLANRELGRRAEAIHAFEVAIALDRHHAPAYNEW